MALSKSKVIGTIIFLFILLVPFKIAYFQNNLGSSFLSAIAMVVVVGGSAYAGYLFLEQPFDKKKK